MSTAGQYLRNVAIEACKDANVAIAANKSFSEWNSVTAPHVFAGTGGFMAGRNKGRCPFLEVYVTTQDFQRDVNEGGTLKSKVEIICHDIGRDNEAVSDKMELILCQCLASIRNVSNDNYMALGSDSLANIEPGPMGWKRTATIDVEHSYSRDSYESNL